MQSRVRTSHLGEAMMVDPVSLLLFSRVTDNLTSNHRLLSLYLVSLEVG